VQKICKNVFKTNFKLNGNVDEILFMKHKNFSLLQLLPIPSTFEKNIAANAASLNINITNNDTFLLLCFTKM